MAQYIPQKDLLGSDVSKTSRQFRDIITSFAVHPSTKDVSAVKNDVAIKQSLKNLVLTQPGEKFYNQDFGSRVYQLLFEPLDPFTVTELKQDIINTIRNYDQRIEVESLTVLPNIDEHYLQVDLKYTIIGSPYSEEVSFILEPPVG